MVAFGSLSLVLVTLSVHLSLSSAQTKNDYRAAAPVASTFYLPETETQFSVNIANDSSDVYFYFASPAYSWVGVGFGGQMENSLMLIMYPNADGNNVTISPRMGRRAGEPVYTNKLGFEMLAGTRIEDGMMILHARCSDCHVWPNGFLNATSPDQQMMYAFGAAYELHSSSPSANLKRHVRYGRFTMNMTSATGTGGIPSKDSTMNNASLQGGMTEDVDRKNLVHAILGCFVLFVVWPLNIFVVGFLRNIPIHLGLSVAMVVCLGAVYGLGISASDQYNRSKSFSTPHQILSFAALVPLILVSVLPIRPLARLHSFIPRLHALLSSLTLTLLLIAGGLGFYLSQQSHPVVLIYTALSLVLVVFLAIMSSIVRRRRSANARAMRRFSLPSTSPSKFGLLAKDVRTGSETSVAGSATSLKGFLDESRRDGGKGKTFGGGTMPGPHYLLNMHPGVPVHIGGGQGM